MMIMCCANLVEELGRGGLLSVAPLNHLDVFVRL